MPATDLEHELRPAALDDAAIVADLETARDPLEPRDSAMLRYWWQMADELQRNMRLVHVRDGVAIAFLGASHDPWSDGGARFGLLRPRLRPEQWNGDGYAALINVGERSATSAR